MYLNEVLETAPGLSRRFVYYLESKGLIAPRKLWKRRIARRDYSDEDARIIRETWSYYRRGYAVSAAHNLATRTDRAGAVVRLKVNPRHWRDALDELRSEAHVREAATVYGSTASLIIRLDTPSETEVYETLVPFMARQEQAGPPHILMAPRGLRRADPETMALPAEDVGMIAYVLLTVPGVDVNQVVEQLREFDAVVEAGTVYGDCDIVAKLVTEDQGQLDSVVMEHIHDIPGVESTRTFIVIPSMYWSREPSGAHRLPASSQNGSEDS